MDYSDIKKQPKPENLGDDGYFDIKYDPKPENLGDDSPNSYENLALPILESAGQTIADVGQQIVDDGIQNEILVLTRDDGIVHNYFYYFECYWDAGDCLSTVILKFPKNDDNMVSYWSKYQGDVYIYSGKEFSKTRFESDEAYNIDNISPIFVGSVSHIKEFYNYIELYVHNIGARFKQKIPEEFRNYYIFNQNVRDTFQAMCEFLGVKYICPPQIQATSSTALENDADAKIDAEKDKQGTATPQVATQKILEGISQMSGSLGLAYLAMNEANAVSNEVQKQEDGETQPNSQPKDMTMVGGFSNVSFDAGGNLVYNSQIIESSPDMAKSIPEFTESLSDTYKDYEEVLNDIEDFLNGKIFETVHNNVMDYGAITIVPQSSSTSSIAPVDENGEEESEEESGDEQDAE